MGLKAPEAPIFRLCHIFENSDPIPPEVVGLLAPFLNNESADIRKNVILAVASTGMEESIPYLHTALRDENGYVKSYVLMGLERALSKRKISADLADQYFDLVAAIWPHDQSFEVCGHLPNVLIRLDPQKAKDRLLQEDLFSIRFNPVWRILDAFNENEVEIPRSKILGLIKELETEPLKYPMDNALEEALSLLGCHHNPEDLPLMEGYLGHENKNAVKGAIKGLYKYHRFFETIRDPWKIVGTDGWNALTRVEKHICAIEELDLEIKNGGFAQYYFNSTGNHWWSAVEGLKAIGAKQHFLSMKATLGRFPESTPAKDRNARSIQLSSVVKGQENPFSKQDSVWYGIKDEDLDLLIYRYNIANRKR